MRKIAVFRLLPVFVLVCVLSPIAGCADFSTPDPDACPSNLGSPILNFCEVTPGTLWRGAKPDEPGAGWLVRKSVGTIINLELLHDDRDTLTAAHLEEQADDRPTLQKTLPAAGEPHDIHYYRVRDWEPLVVVAPWLTDERVATFLAVMSQAPKPVYVHCRSGQNRTGVMVAAYRVMLDSDGSTGAIEQAVAEMQRYRGFWFDADAAYIRGLTPERQKAIRERMQALLPKVASEREALIRCTPERCQVQDD
ncbi:MAG TPA: protein-tyrosine phosphatase family protein [Dongiaceae bacterium]|nr:protein-tyrosine phosphatase family protein [Dongiaceae bacterium]